MRCLGAFAAAVCLALFVATAQAEPKKPRLPLGTNPHPVIWGGMKPRPAPPRPKLSQPQPPRRDCDHHNGHRPSCHGPRRVYVPYYYGGCYGVPYYLGDYYGVPWPYPIFVPIPIPQPLPQVELPIEDEPPAPQRATGARSVALGWKFINYGDARFAKGDVAGAAERYATATRNAPQLADAWFRRGFALAAAGRYDAAARHIRHGLQLDPKWPSAPADLRALFAGDAQALRAYLDALLEDAADRPLDADVLFVVGVHLYCAGQRDAAEQLFRRAQNLDPADDSHIRAFLGK